MERVLHAGVENREVWYGWRGHYRNSGGASVRQIRHEGVCVWCQVDRVIPGHRWRFPVVMELRLAQDGEQWCVTFLVF